MEGTYYIRISNHIQEDLGRKWSSWNFGQAGFVGTREDLVSYIEGQIESEGCLFISEMEVYPTSVADYFTSVEVNGGKAIYRELYANYWVCVDQRFDGSLACCELGYAESLEDAKNEYVFELTDLDGTQLPSDAVLVYSEDEIHIFCVPC